MFRKPRKQSVGTTSRKRHVAMYGRLWSLHAYKKIERSIRLHVVRAVKPFLGSWGIFETRKSSPSEPNIHCVVTCNRDWCITKFQHHTRAGCLKRAQCNKTIHLRRCRMPNVRQHCADFIPVPYWGNFGSKQIRAKPQFDQLPPPYPICRSLNYRFDCDQYPRCCCRVFNQVCRKISGDAQSRWMQSNDRLWVLVPIQNYS